MIATFKANNPYNTFLLLIYGVLLKLSVFLHPVIPKPQQTDGFLFKALLKQLSGIGSGLPFIYSLITYILLFTQAVSFNRLVNEQKLIQKPNYLTAMSFLLITSLFQEWNILSAPLIVNTLLIWVWARMSALHNNSKPKATLFNIGLAIGLSTFFYIPSIAFSVLVVFGLILTRPFKLAEWLMSLLGIITPYYFLFSWMFITDKWQGYKFPGVAIQYPLFIESRWAAAAIIIVLVASVIGIYFIQKNFLRQLVQSRKSWNLIFLYTLVAIFVPFINETRTFQYWILCAVPFSAYVGCAFFYTDRKWLPAALHWLMVAFVIALGYFVK